MKALEECRDPFGVQSTFKLSQEARRKVFHGKRSPFESLLESLAPPNRRNPGLEEQRHNDSQENFEPLIREEDVLPLAAATTILVIWAVFWKIL